MYHLEITKSVHATEKKFNKGRKIEVVINNDYDNIDSLKSTVLQKYNIELNDDNNEYIFEKQEDPNEITQYLIRISHN